KNGANVQEHSLGPARADTNERTISFYERTIRGSTWMHVKAFQTRNDDPLAVRFSVKTTTQPVRFRWEFGDGDQSPVAEPIHVFPQEGTFRVRVMVEMEDGKRAMRMVDVQVPGLRVSRVTNEG
ncbi:MAG: PKD domain-containing protein, partial [Phycisphaerae bacterium]